MVLEYIIGSILIALAGLLIWLIGAQQGRRRGLGNSIAGQGASESYLAKNNIGGKDKKYQKWTLIVAIVFVVLVLALYIVGSIDNTDSEDVSSTVDTSSAVVETSSATESSEAVSSEAESSAVESSVAESSADVSSNG
ncbi:MAG: preprotein translocase subunit SecG [Clostridia bacterium]|nr:preprotein translocase subunit SecG [Clostridia bacterium]